MRKTFSRIAVALMVIAVMFSGAAGLALASQHPTVTANSDLDEGVTVDNFEANSANNSIVEVDASNEDLTLEVIDPATDTAHLTLDNDSDEFTVENDTDGIYSWNISHDQLETIPMGAGESKDVTIEVTDEVNEEANNFTVTLNNTNDRAVVHADGADNAIVDVEEREPLLGIFTSNLTDYHTVEETVDVDGDNTTVAFHLDGATADAYSDAADGAESGDWLAGFALQGDGELYRVYYQEAPDDVEDGDTYAVYDDSADAVTLTLGDDYADHDTAEVTLGNFAAGNLDDVGIMDLVDAFGVAGAISAFGISLLSVVAIGRRSA